MTTVAIVIPTHNRPRMLAFTLRSVLAQRGVELAVTIVDDGSSNSHDVPAVIEALGDSRVDLVRHDTPRGVAAARNTGIASTSSDWVAFCDDDDVWAPEKLNAQLLAAQSNSAGWAYTGDVAIDGDLRVLHGAPPLPPEQLATELEHYNPVPAGSSNVMVRRTVLDTVGCFDPKLLSVADWDLWVRLGRHGRPAWVPQTVRRLPSPWQHHHPQPTPDAERGRHRRRPSRAAGGPGASLSLGGMEQHAGRSPRGSHRPLCSRRTGRGPRLDRAIGNCACRSRNSRAVAPTRAPTSGAGKRRRGSTPCVEPPMADRHG